MNYSGRIKLKKKYNARRNEILDERQTQSIGNAGGIITLITVFYLLIEITYKYVSTKDILSCSWEIILLIIISVVFIVANRKEKELNLPKSIFGRILPTEKTKAAHKTRVISYFFKSLSLAVSLIFFTVIFSLLGVEEVYPIPLLVLQFAGIFIIFFVLDYIWGEHLCKKYNQWLKNIDE
jgi:hypothetical protein